MTTGMASLTMCMAGILRMEMPILPMTMVMERTVQASSVPRRMAGAWLAPLEAVLLYESWHSVSSPVREAAPAMQSLH